MRLDALTGSRKPENARSRGFARAAGRTTCRISQERCSPAASSANAVTYTPCAHGKKLSRPRRSGLNQTETVLQCSGAFTSPDLHSPC